MYAIYSITEAIFPSEFSNPETRTEQQNGFAITFLVFLNFCLYPLIFFVFWRCSPAALHLLKIALRRSSSRLDLASTIILIAVKYSLVLNSCKLLIK